MKHILLLLISAATCDAGTLYVHSNWVYNNTNSPYYRGVDYRSYQVDTKPKGVVTESFLSRIALRESGNNPLARGKAGERGVYQMLPIAVADVNAWFGWNKSFREATTIFARQYAEAFLIMQESRLRKRLGRQPTEVEVYRAWNRGFRGATR